MEHEREQNTAFRVYAAQASSTLSAAHPGLSQACRQSWDTQPASSLLAPALPPRGVMQQVSVDRAGGQLHVAYNRPSDEAVSHGQLHTKRPLSDGTSELS